MKTPEEIKKGLNLCHCNECYKCPYYESGCLNGIFDDAFIYIEKLEERIRLMLIQMRGDCGCCKHAACGIGTEPCASCVHSSAHDAWEYRGLPGDE